MTDKALRRDSLGRRARAFQFPEKVPSPSGRLMQNYQPVMCIKRLKGEGISPNRVSPARKYGRIVDNNCRLDYEVTRRMVYIKYPPTTVTRYTVSASDIHRLPNRSSSIPSSGV